MGGWAKAKIFSVISCSDSMPGMMGSTSTQPAASSSPRTSTFLGAASRTPSRFVNTPRPPALQPPRSRYSCSPLLPSPCSRSSAVITAFTMRAPRNAKPKVLLLAGASPNPEDAGGRRVSGAELRFAQAIA